MKTVNPYLNFSGNTEEVFKFYQSVFGEELNLIRFTQMDAGMCAPDALGKVAHVSLSLTDDIAETEQLFNALSNAANPRCRCRKPGGPNALAYAPTATAPDG